MELRPIISIEDELTGGKFYRIVDRTDTEYFVINNNKVKRNYPKSIFEREGEVYTYAQVTGAPNLGRLVEKHDTDTWKKTAWGGLDKYARLLKTPCTPEDSVEDNATNNGGSTDYYKFDPEWKEVSDIIEAKDMGFNIGNIFKSCFRLGGEHHSSRERDLNKIIYFAQRELNLLKNKK
jgi:hypothetical protein